jgi:hypothetical protein
MSDTLLARAKAIVAVLVPLIAMAVAAVGNVRATNIWLAVVAVLVATGVYVTPNKAAT